MLGSLLPIDGLALLTDFLQFTDVSLSNSNVDLSAMKLPFAVAAEIEKEDKLRKEKAHEVLRKMSLCDNELLRAEKQSLLAERLSKLKSLHKGTMIDDDASKILPALVNHEQPHSASNQFRDAMHSALMTVMEERDEAHARMLSAGVLHVHEMEQQRKKTENLTTELEVLKQSAPTAKGSRSNNSNNEKEPDPESLRKLKMQRDSDAELISLCQQLAGEISARTSASLEVVRLKESRKIEQENEAIEKQALKDEISQLRQQLSRERKRSQLARRESGSWRESFQEAVLGAEASTSPAPPPTRREQLHQERRGIPADDVSDPQDK